MSAKQSHPANRLISETSPYLLQHAYNPVDWLPFGEEAFRLAREKNKPLLISIGYSACHWCHVMEHESFEDAQIASVMNEHFINVKVDREERADVDMLYMQAVQLMTGHGGWPLNCFVLPDGRPFYGGTYFPKAQWLNILQRLAELYRDESEKVQKYAEELTGGIRQSELLYSAREPGDEVSAEMLKETVFRWKKQMDNEDGGPNRAPKFPLPGNYSFLLRFAVLQKDDELLKHVNLTLRKMAFGGIYDQLHGGFCRYSTDMIWKVPHFEKMLYDNAQLASLYLEAFTFTKNRLYLEVAEEVLAFVEREWRAAEGYFYSAYDADSEGEEGKYYVWTEQELRMLLEGDFNMFAAYYHIDDTGYWEHDNYILMRREDVSAYLSEQGISLADMEQGIEACHKKLRKAAAQRTKPGLDDKCITSWNGLMCSAFARAYLVTGKEQYGAIAQKNLDFLLSKLRKSDGELFRTYKNGVSKISGFLDDYAFVAEACIQCYLASANEYLLQTAVQLTKKALDLFENPESPLLYYTASTGETLVARTSESSDNVIPSSNAQMAHNLFLLGRYFERSDWEERAGKMLRVMREDLRLHGASFSHWGALGLYFAFPLKEVAIVGKNVDEMLRTMVNHGLTNTIFAVSEDLSELPLLKDRFVKDRTMLYVCENKTCQLPVESAEEALKQFA